MRVCVPYAERQARISKVYTARSEKLQKICSADSKQIDRKDGRLQ